MFEKEIRQKLLERGAAIVGFCKIDSSPVKELPDHVFCVSICVKLSDSVLKTITDRPSISYFQHYRTVNTRLDQLALDTVSFIEEKGYGAFPIAASQSIPGNPYFGIFQH
ncbi:MAG TPA: epoxyqueuosine reductase, partial [Clostridiales bacterium]|nr:epoxyqueuosine reductase [Clostridiales bacterium]